MIGKGLSKILLFAKFCLYTWIFAKQFFKDYENRAQGYAIDIKTVIERRVGDINPSYSIIKVSDRKLV